MFVDFPFHIDARGRTAATTGEDHVRDLIEQVLFTTPGERVNRPDFGSGVLQLVFAPNSDELATATEFLVRSALQQWLPEVAEIQAVEVTARDATLSVAVRYRPQGSPQVRTATFARPV